MSTELLKIPEIPRPENMPMVVLSESGIAYLDKAEEMATKVIQPGNELIIANETANTLNRLVKEVEGKRLIATKPMREFLSEYKGAVDSKTERPKSILKALKNGIFECDRKIQVAHQEELKKAEVEEERRRKIQESHKERGHEVKEDITPVAKPIDPAITSPIKWRKEWKATEITDETLVPRAYLSVDMAKLRAAVKSGTREIPGVKIEETKMQIH